MKKCILLLVLISSIEGFCQYTDIKISKVFINKSKIDTINKTGRVSLYPYFYNNISEDEIKELSKILGIENIQTKFYFNLNYKITSEGRVIFVKDCKGLHKKSVPDELRGIPEFDKTDNCNNQELIDYLNHYFESKRIIFKFFTNRETKQEISDLTQYSDYLFNFDFQFHLQKKYSLINPIKRKG